MSERQPNIEYHDPELIEQAAGDQALLDRLVGLRKAEAILSQDMENESSRRLVEAMQLAVNEYLQGGDTP